MRTKSINTHEDKLKEALTNMACLVLEIKDCEILKKKKRKTANERPIATNPQ